MNFLAHSAIAGQLAANQPAYALGAVLPDLAGMAGIAGQRFDPQALPGAVAAGVSCHHRADAAFHADRVFLEGARTMRQALEQAGCTTGAGRAVGHVGWELLLDGALVHRPAVTDRFLEALGQASSVEHALVAGADRWAQLVEHLMGHQWWRRYDEPDFVAERLYRQLARRPRLAFSRQAIPQVAHVLAASQPAITREADAVVNRVVVQMGAVGTRIC